MTCQGKGGAGERRSAKKGCERTKRKNLTFFSLLFKESGRGFFPEEGKENRAFQGLKGKNSAKWMDFDLLLWKTFKF